MEERQPMHTDAVGTVTAVTLPVSSDADSAAGEAVGTAGESAFGADTGGGAAWSGAPVDWGKT